jgi:hypothetical protein
MATTDSGTREKVDAMRRNGWSACSGTSGRHPSESMVGMARIMHSSQKADCMIKQQNKEGVLT